MLRESQSPMLRTVASRSVRALSTTRAVMKEEDLIQAVFLRKIREYASKQKAAGGKLVDSNADVERSLEDELNRLANKFHIESAAAVRELPTKFETIKVESAVQTLLEGRKISELKSEVRKQTEDYIAERKAKKAEEEARRAALLHEEKTNNPQAVTA
uniref:ATP synthase-coupling factor 6, mitochondrial n=1 Tax=Ascaris lumbricoides TaxID=6252 RepID=A0A0M3I8G4_ASCLU